MKRTSIFNIFFFLLFSFAVQAEDVHYLTTEQFKQYVFDYTKSSDWHYQGDKPCVIDFYTTWCGPCKKLSPIMEELAAELCDEVIFYKVDTEKERELAYFFQINSIPQILFVPVEGMPQLARGLLPKQTLRQAIDEVLLNKPKKD